jgi:hypothetical protein
MTLQHAYIDQVFFVDNTVIVLAFLRSYYPEEWKMPASTKGSRA